MPIQKLGGPAFERIECGDQAEVLLGASIGHTVTFSLSDFVVCEPRFSLAVGHDRRSLPRFEFVLFRGQVLLIFLRM